MKFRVATRCSKLLCLGLWGYLILCLGFTRTAVSSAAERVRLAVPTVAVMYAPIYLGIHQGIFAAEGMELEISICSGPQSALLVGCPARDRESQHAQRKENRH